MRFFAIAVLVGSALALSGASEGRAGAWCAWYDPYTYNCEFNAREQCQAIVGTDAYCAPNEAPP